MLAINWCMLELHVVCKYAQYPAACNCAMYRQAPEESPVILAEFKIQGQSISQIKVHTAHKSKLHYTVTMLILCIRLQVDSLSVTNEKYKPYKGVRSITKAGKFQIRT